MSERCIRILVMERMELGMVGVEIDGRGREDAVESGIFFAFVFLDGIEFGLVFGLKLAGFRVIHYIRKGNKVFGCRVYLK